MNFGKRKKKSRAEFFKNHFYKATKSVMMERQDKAAWMCLDIQQLLSHGTLSVASKKSPRPPLVMVYISDGPVNT